MPTFKLRRRHPDANPNQPRPTGNAAPTEHELTAALCGLGISALTRAILHGGSGFAFATPIVPDRDGWAVGIDLPYGVTANDVILHRPALASGLRRPIGAVWPTGEPDIHPGRLNLWIAKQPIHRRPQAAWPLACAGTANLAAPIPLGTDARGRRSNSPWPAATSWSPAAPAPASATPCGCSGAPPPWTPTPSCACSTRAAPVTSPHSDASPSSHLTGCDEPDAEEMLAGLRQLRQQIRDRLANLKALPPATSDGSTRTPLPGRTRSSSSSTRYRNCSPAPQPAGKAARPSPTCCASARR